jgi:hypothetical protein
MSTVTRYLGTPFIIFEVISTFEYVKEVNLVETEKQNAEENLVTTE